MSKKRFQQSITGPKGTFTSFINGNEASPNEDDVTFQGFTSYIDLSQEPQDVLSNDGHESNWHLELNNDLQPNLLPGEGTIFSLDKVLKFNSFMNLKHGVSGALHITNYKLSFVTSSKLPKGLGYKLQNSVTCENDIPFTNIDCIYQVFSQSRKKKMLPGNTIMQPCKYLIIHCRDFRIHSFGFKLVTDKDQIVKLLRHISVHAFPGRGSLLFAFEYASEIEDPDSHLAVDVPMFSKRSDWEHEIHRLHCSDAWRVTDVNENFNMSTSLPKYFVVPRNVNDAELLDTASRFEDDRLLCWCYTSCAGTSLVRMSCLKPGMNSLFSTFENRFVDSVRMTTKTDVEICELINFCPSLKEISSSGEKIRELCMTDLIKDFWSKDSIWLSSLEETKWLTCVQRCLKLSVKIINLMIEQKISVIIKEARCRDLACLISSLVQLLLDPYYRTIQGFQALIQREWVAMGHPFQERCGIVTLADSEKSPVFLLFLDCAWQLISQFPASFEFSETYLTILWDSIHTGLFHTFLFNSQHQESLDQKKFWNEQRQSPNQSQRRISCLPSIWKWKNLLEEHDQSLLYNPLYVIYNSKFCCHPLGCTDEALMSPEKESMLYPQTDIALLKLWSQCYTRWLYPGQINGGGRMSLYLQQCLLVEEVLTLQKKITELNLLNNKGLGDVASAKDDWVNSHLVFGSNLAQESCEITSSFPFSNANAVSGMGANPSMPLLSLNSYTQGSSVIQAVSAPAKVS